MLSEETMTAIPQFFQGGSGPSHDELTRAFARTGLSHLDPGNVSGVGKVKRVREVLGHAVDRDRDSGSRLVEILIDAIRAHGAFRPRTDTYAGEETIQSLRDGLRHLGYDLDAEGVVRPTRLEGLEGIELTEALWSYVRRARTGAGDAELVIGSSKSLEEATARHVLKEVVGTYETRGPKSHFQMQLAQAFSLVDLKTSGASLSSDASEALQQALFLLGIAVNRLRNEKGEGHGRPEPSSATQKESRLASQASGLLCELLLHALEEYQATANV